MVFSSVPGYLDPPNWQQQPVVNCGDENPQFQPPVPPPPPLAGVGTNGPIRPVSMTERARLAQLPIPETALKCPRCESTNTKFCYFNNYNLTQPRHFCKTCRRYWTRGGTLRNVPVGGGCRRNKRNKRNSRSKSPVITAAGNSSNNSAISNMMVQLDPPPLQQLPLLPYYGGAGNIGLSFEGADIGFQMGNSSSTVARFSEQWRIQQLQQLKHFPLLEQPAGIYQLQGEEASVEASNYQFVSKPLDSGVSRDQLGGAVKMEENQGLNLAKNFLGTNRGNDQYYGGHAWTDLTGFTSSSTTHLL